MFALIAGRGRLPQILADRLEAQDERFIICTLKDQPSNVASDAERLTFRVEQLGSLFKKLNTRGVTDVVMAGGIDRPNLSPFAIDFRTLPLIMQLKAATTMGDDGALRVLVRMFHERGIRVRAAQDIAPDLLMAEGVPTRAQPGPEALISANEMHLFLQEAGSRDLGQAAIMRGAEVLIAEDDRGTAAMIAQCSFAQGAVLIKGPKPQQDRRVDLPTIGPETVRSIVEAGLDGIIIAAQDVLVLDQEQVIEALDRHGKFLWAKAL